MWFTIIKKTALKITTNVFIELFFSVSYRSISLIIYEPVYLDFDLKSGQAVEIWKEKNN